ncbi:hypothetical protein M406DRAFT_237359, partial [Cryphonectria parasitica EP155]
YDYIIVGGGPSGLVVANRLTEDADVTVLLLEAGTLDTEGYTVMVPSEVGADLNTNYDWNLRTVGQEYLDGQAVVFNQGKVVGGGTVLNGMVWTRGSAQDYDAWDNLNNNGFDTPTYGWGWMDLLPYFEKSETFVMDVDDATTQEFGIESQSDIHGETGPVQIAYPHFLYPQSANILQGFEQLGVPALADPNNGTGGGAFINPSSMSASNQSRCDARVAYLDPVINRANLHIATEQMVTRLLLEQDADGTSQRAVGVEVPQNATVNVTCTNEVILAAGAIFSPTLLQISGIGPSDVLESLGVPVVIDLPGVGANLQDHGMNHPRYLFENSSLLTADKVTSNADALNAATEEYYANRTGPLTAPMISTIAFPSMELIADDWAELLQNASQSDVDTTLPAGTAATVRQGYLAQLQQQLPLLRDPAEGAVEILADSIGTISTAMQRPLSRGTVRPSSASIFDMPLVDPRYCSEPLDCLAMARALLFNCELINTAPVAELQPAVQSPYFCPTTATTSDINAQLLALVKQNIATEFHPSGTTAMLPLELGGVVDSELVVYGTTNLRVVNAGIMPVLVGAHLQAPVYAIAER